MNNFKLKIFSMEELMINMNAPEGQEEHFISAADCLASLIHECIDLKKRIAELEERQPVVTVHRIDPHPVRNWCC